VIKVQPLQEPVRRRRDSAGEVRSDRASVQSPSKTNKTEFVRAIRQAPPNWQEHGLGRQKDRVSISEDARHWQEGQWLNDGLEADEDPAAVAKEVVRSAEFLQHAKKSVKPRISLREMAKKTGQPHPTQRETLDVPPDQVAQAPEVDPKIAMAARHAPLDGLLNKPPQTLNVRGQLALPGGQNIPLIASFEMGSGGVMNAAFKALGE